MMMKGCISGLTNRNLNRLGAPILCRMGPRTSCDKSCRCLENCVPANLKERIDHPRQLVTPPRKKSSFIDRGMRPEGAS